ncbi:MAG TPA: ABC transporter permease [Gemmatimonadaceae bacterium]
MLTTAQARALLTEAIDSARTAGEAVAHNKLRAGLTSLGILFGVASVIAMLAIGKGAEQEILAQMKLLGSNNVIITPLKEQKEGEVEKDPSHKEQKRFSPGLTLADAQGIKTVMPDVDAVSGELVLNTLVTRQGLRRSGKLVGVEPDYFSLLNLELARGTMFSPGQIARSAPVAIIGHGVKARFFPREDPVGRSIKVGNEWLTVVGVLADRRVGGDMSQRLGIRDANMDVYAPLPTVLLRYRNRAKVTNRDIEASSREAVVVEASDAASQQDEDAVAERKNPHQLDRVIVRTANASLVPPMAEVLRKMLTRRHNEVVDFEITVPELLLKQEQRTKTIFNIVLGSIASISLIVGGIGIMNIMLASILERIREIGVRRAVGATQRNVLAQFLAEAVMISVAGGIAGIVLGGVFSFGIERVAGIRTIVSGLSIAVAFGVSVATGLIFGIVPAWRAARQDPVVCLRYE